MRAFLIGIAVAAIGWETGSMAAEPPPAARSVPLISMGATNPQRPFRPGEDAEDQTAQEADNALLQPLHPECGIHALGHRVETRVSRGKDGVRSEKHRWT